MSCLHSWPVYVSHDNVRHCVTANAPFRCTTALRCGASAQQHQESLVATARIFEGPSLHHYYGAFLSGSSACPNTRMPCLLAILRTRWAATVGRALRIAWLLGTLNQGGMVFLSYMELITSIRRDIIACLRVRVRLVRSSSRTRGVGLLILDIIER